MFHLIRNTYREKIRQTQELFCHLAPVVQKIDSAIHRINHSPVAKYKGNQLLYPVDRADLSDGLRYPPFEQPRPDIQNQEVISQTRVGVFHAMYKHRGLEVRTR